MDNPSRLISAAVVCAVCRVPESYKFSRIYPLHQADVPNPEGGGAAYPVPPISPRKSAATGALVRCESRHQESVASSSLPVSRGSIVCRSSCFGIGVERVRTFDAAYCCCCGCSGFLCLSVSLVLWCSNPSYGRPRIDGEVPAPIAELQALGLPGQVESLSPMRDFTPPESITLLFTDLGVLTPSAVSDELIKLYY